MIRCLAQLLQEHATVIRLKQPSDSDSPVLISVPFQPRDSPSPPATSLKHHTAAAPARMLMPYHSGHWENKWPYVAFASGAVTVKNNGCESTAELNDSLLWSSSEYFKCCLERVGLCASINISLMQFFFCTEKMPVWKSELKCKKKTE